MNVQPHEACLFFFPQLPAACFSAPEALQQHDLTAWPDPETLLQHAFSQAKPGAGSSRNPSSIKSDAVQIRCSIKAFLTQRYVNTGAYCTEVRMLFY